MNSGDGNNNVIVNFGMNDTITMIGGSIQSFAFDGDDLVVNLKGRTLSGKTVLKDVKKYVDAGYEFVTGSKKKELILSGVNRILNRTDNTLVSGSDGKDWIENSGSGVTIKPGAGDDTIVGSDLYSEIYALNSGAGDTLRIGDGTIDRTSTDNDGNYIVDIKQGNYIAHVTLEGAGDYDWVESTDKKSLTTYSVTKIINRRDNQTVAGTGGDDIITNTGKDAVIQAKTGNDTITGSDTFGDLFQLSSSDGNNVITNFGMNDTLQMTAGKTLMGAVSGDDYIVTLKGNAYTGIETLKGAAGLPLKKVTKNKIQYLVADGITNITNDDNNKTVTTSGGRDYVINTGEGVTIQGSLGDDTIEGSDAFGELFNWNSAYGNDVIVNFHSNDTLYMAGGKNMTWSEDGNDVIVTLKGTAFTGTVTLKDAAGLNFKKSSNGKYLTAEGINTIENNDNGTKVTGTDGDDYIYNYAMNASIEGKTGNDTIEGSSFAETFLFSSGEGDNVITNFGANDTLRMTAGKTLTYETVGADVVVTLKGKAFTGHETLLGAAGLNFKTAKKNGLWNLYVEDITTSLNYADSVKVTGTGGDDYIYNFGENVTIESKGGNDTLVGSDLYGEVFNFNSTDGDNVIVNFGDGDTLKVLNGTVTSYAADGDDYVVTISGSNNTTATVKLLDAAADDKMLKWTDAKTLRIRSLEQTSSAEMAAPESDYWFLNEENTEAQPLNEIMLTEAALDLDTSIDLLKDINGSARSDQISAMTFARHQNKK